MEPVKMGFSDDDTFITKKPKLMNATFEEAVAETGFGKFNIGMIIVSGITLFAVNTECFTVGFVLPAAECEWDLTTATKGILTSAMFIGIILTCFLWGYFSDSYGRKKLLVVSTFLTFVLSFISVFVTSFWAFVVVIFFKGICISCPSAVIFAYFGEFQSEKMRSKGLSFVSYFIAVAFINLPGMAWLIIPSDISLDLFGHSFTSWRIFLLVCTIPTLLSAIGLCLCPESPKYLFYSGQIDEAYRILSEIYASNTGKNKEDFPVESLEVAITKTEKASLASQILPLVKKPYWKVTLASCYMEAAVSAISSGLFIWYPDIINQLSTAENGGLTICQALELSDNKNGTLSCQTADLDPQMFIQNIIVGCGYLVGYSSWSFLVNMMGNANFSNCCMAISSVGTVLILFITQKLIIDILFVVILVLPGINVAIIISMVVDVMPTHLSAMSVSLNQTAARFGSIVSSSIVGIMLEWSCSTTFSLYAATLAACLFASIVFYTKKKHVVDLI